MAYLNEHYLKLQAGYLFPEVARRVREFCEAYPEGAAGSVMLPSRFRPQLSKQ